MFNATERNELLPLGTIRPGGVVDAHRQPDIHIKVGAALYSEPRQHIAKSSTAGRERAP